MQTREGEKAGTRGALSLQGVWSCEFSVTEPSPVPQGQPPHDDVRAPRARISDAFLTCVLEQTRRPVLGRSSRCRAWGQ